MKRMPAVATLEEVVYSLGLRASRDPACVLDESNRIVYCNPAWDRFAEANHGVLARSERVLGLDILTICSDAVAGYYRNLFGIARSSSTSTIHGYHCSSPELLRTYRMLVEPQGQFLVLTHILIEERPHPELAHEPADCYVRNGLVTLCSNCRRAHNRQSDSWDWVPVFLHAEESFRCSHGLCPPCSQFYFPGVAADLARARSKK